MRKRILFVVNPNAGRGEIRAKFLDVVRLLSQNGDLVTVYPSKAQGDILHTLPLIGGDYDLVVASGGDGTINETVSGIMSLEPRPAVAFIPAGTVNDTASNLRLPRSILPAAKIAVLGNTMPYDVQSFNDRWFLYVAAFGAFTDVPYATPQERKNVLGFLAYLMQGVHSLSELKTYHVRLTLPDQEIEDDVLLGLVSSTTSVAGFHPNSELFRTTVKLNDGLFEILLVKRPKNLAEFNAIVGSLLRLDFRSPNFYFFQADEVTFHFSEPVPWTLDGEYGGDVACANLKCHHSALNVCVPAKNLTK